MVTYRSRCTFDRYLALLHFIKQYITGDNTSQRVITCYMLLIKSNSTLSLSLKRGESDRCYKMLYYKTVNIAPTKYH